MKHNSTIKVPSIWVRLSLLLDPPDLTGFMSVVSVSNFPFICKTHLVHKNKLNSVFLLLNVSFFLELNQLSIKGEVKAYGAITYDSTANKLRFRSNESQPTNGSLGLDLLMFFNEVQFTFLPWEIPLFCRPWHLGLWLCLGRAYSMRLTAKTRAVRKRTCTAPCTRWTFLMLQSFTA